MQAICSLLMFLGRLCLGAYFLVEGIFHLANYSKTLEQVQNAGVPQAGILTFAAIAILGVGGVLLILGYWTRFAAFLLGAVLIASLVYLHPWLAKDAEPFAQAADFFRSIGILGGLLYILCSGAGGISCGRQKKIEQEEAES